MTASIHRRAEIPAGIAFRTVNRFFKRALHNDQPEALVQTLRAVDIALRIAKVSVKVVLEGLFKLGDTRFTLFRGGFLRRAALLGFLLIAPLVTKAAPVAQVQEEALAENQTAAETDADAEKKAKHWRRKIGGEEFINVHVAYSFCLAFAGGVVFGFAVWCVPNIIILHLNFKEREK